MQHGLHFASHSPEWGSPLSLHDPLIDAAAPAVQERLRTVQHIARSVAPQAEEVVAYKLPAFREGRVFLYFAAFKKHVGIYPPVTGDPELLEALAPYRGPKGNLKFLHTEPLPEALLRRVIEQLHRQYAR